MQVRACESSSSFMHTYTFQHVGVESVELCDRFWYWLEDAGTPPGFRSMVVKCVACKLDATYPGLYGAYITSIMITITIS